MLSNAWTFVVDIYIPRYHDLCVIRSSFTLVFHCIKWTLLVLSCAKYLWKLLFLVWVNV